MNKSPYARLTPAGNSYEYGAVLRREGERDIMFAQGEAPDHDTAIAKANEVTPTLIDYHAAVEYGTPGGNIGNWSGVVLAPHTAAAHKAADLLVRKQRKVARIFKINIRPPGEQQPLVSLPDLAVILHNANTKAGAGVPFEDIARDLLAYRVPTARPDLASPPAPPPRDAGIMIAVQNIVRAALRELADRDSITAEIAKTVRGMHEYLDTVKR